MNINDVSASKIIDIGLVIGYLGGCFGNSLAMIIKAASTGSSIDPNAKNFHVMQWPYDIKHCMITYDSDLVILRQLFPGEALQVHCLNGHILTKKFPQSKSILLTCDAENEMYAIHRQWMILNDLSKPKLELVNNAWDWINFNLGHYETTGRILDHQAKTY
jgi:hypothetical protein